MHFLFKITIAVAGAALLLTSCRKKGDNEHLEDENKPSFMSSQAGSWWMYGSNEATVTKRVATGLDSMMMGLQFDYYEKTDTNTQYVTAEYFAINGENYLMLLDLDGSQTHYMNVIINKDNAVQGATWDNTGSVQYSGINFTLKTEGTVIETGATMTVNGITYTDVTTTKNVLKGKPSISPSFVNCGSVTMSFAKDVGIIKSDFDISILGYYTRQYQDSLLAYHIEP
jgi:hypothetical protein